MAHPRAPIDADMLARVLEGRLKTNGLSQRAAAPLIGVNFNTVSRTCKGQVPGLAAYTLICQWLDLSLDTFVLSPGPP